MCDWNYNFYYVCIYVCMYQDATWCGGRPRPWPHCVWWGPSCPQMGHKPQFLTHVCCGQMAGWIKMLLGTEVGLGQGDIVLDGDLAPPPQKKGAQQPYFLVHVYCGQMVAHFSNYWALAKIAFLFSRYKITSIYVQDIFETILTKVKILLKILLLRDVSQILILTHFWCLPRGGSLTFFPLVNTSSVTFNAASVLLLWLPP